MKFLWPNTLFARLMLIWLIGITAVVGISISVLQGERGRHSSDLQFEGLAREIAAAVDILDQLSPTERSEWMDTLGRRRLRLSLRPPPRNAHPVADQRPLAQVFSSALPDHAVKLFSLTVPDAPPGSAPRRLLVEVQLSDGTPVSFRLPVPPPAPPAVITPERVTAALIAFIIGLSLLAWLAVRIVTRPLSRLASAAHAFGADPNAEQAPLPTRGPSEVAAAANAFNLMQQRIRAYVDERTRILAAISHDLQTPITRLRLRSEMIDDDDLRSRLQSDLDAMQSLVEEGLAYARSLNTTAPFQPTDLNALLAVLQDEATDMGWSVSVSGTATTPCMCQPDGLRRALWNLVQNGIKFGGRVSLQLNETASHHIILVRDAGPGLPENELEKVFDPFYRSEQSRNRETGGTGLGLAITRNLLQQQHGTVSLRNHPEGGLEACVMLAKQ